MAGQARAGDGPRVPGARLLHLVEAGAPPEGAVGGAGRWPPREPLLRRSCVSVGAIDGSGVLTQNVHSAPITQQAEKLSFARAEKE
jgi:hypothetical protein